MRCTTLLAVLYASAASASPFMHIGIPVSSGKSDVDATSTLAAALPSSTLNAGVATGSGAPRYIPGTNLPWPHPRIPIHHNDLFQPVDIQGMAAAVPSPSTSADVNIALATSAPSTPKVVRTEDISTLPEVSIQALDVPAQPDMSIQITDPVPEASVQTLSSFFSTAVAAAESGSSESSDSTDSSGADDSTTEGTEDSSEDSSEDNTEDSNEDSTADEQ